VVVAIIALLVAVLVPSLSRARTQTKITSCKANSKQIGIAIATYQTEENGYVPIMLNWHSGPVYNAPARAVFLSVALRRGERAWPTWPVPRRRRVRRLTRTGVSSGTRDDYEARFLPEHYVCRSTRTPAVGPPPKWSRAQPAHQWQWEAKWSPTRRGCGGCGSGDPCTVSLSAGAATGQRPAQVLGPDLEPVTSAGNRRATLPS